VLDEIDLRTRCLTGHAKNSRLFVAWTDGHEKGWTDRLEIRLDVAHGAIERQKRDDVESGRLLECGEAGYRLGEPSGPGIRGVFRGDMDDRDRLTAGPHERRVMNGGAND